MRLAAAYTGYLREPEVASSSHWCVPETSSLMAQRPLCSGQRAQGIPLRCTLLPGKKDGAEARLARPRAFQSVIDLCEREHLDHGANARLCGKGQRFLRILGVAAIQARIVRLPKMSWRGSTVSAALPVSATTTMVPFLRSPDTNAEAASAAGAVTRMTAAPPSAYSASAASVAPLSM